MKRAKQTDNAARQASLKAHRERIGLVLVRLWVARSDVARVRGYVGVLADTRRLRERAKR